MKRFVLIAIAGIFAYAGVCLAAGVLVPTDQSLPPLGILYQSVAVDMRDQVANTRVEQVFLNTTSNDLEATYIFPLPKEASITDFALYINGKRVSGELLKKGEARRIYEDIVRRMRDPGLLEYMDSNLLRARVYPVPRHGKQKIELSYSQIVQMEAGVARYVYPLRTGERAARTIEDFSMVAKIHSKVHIKSVYSPSHEVSIDRRSDNEVTVGFEKAQAFLDRDFVLYYTVSEKEIGLNLIAQKRKGEDGFFLLMIAPKTGLSADEIIDKDVTFVVDTSGSMSGIKMAQAKEAMRYCLKNLREGDRFNVIRFATEVEAFSDKLLPAVETHVKPALDFVDKFEASGSTNIDEALRKALSVEPSQDRPHMLFFVTDGKPTVGIRDAKTILENADKANRGKARVFVFGVGSDLNTHLLDQLADRTKGTREYVMEDEKIDEKISGLSRRLLAPVLSEVELKIDGINVYDQYPKEIPVLFGGGQVILLGRYERAGDAAVTISGVAREKPRKFDYEATFPDEESANEFVENLWANRKVGYLLDHVRLYGEEKEIVDEIISLSQKYGILTPYTSYLVTEAPTRVREGEPAVSDRAFVAPAPPGPARERLPSDSVDTMMLRMGAEGAPAAGADRKQATQYLRATESGARAVDLSVAVEEMKKAEVSGARQAARRVGEKLFHNIQGTWVDSTVSRDMPAVEIKYASDAYFKLLEARPELRKYMELGTSVIVKLDGKVLRVGEEGKETLTEEEIREMFKR